MRQRRRRRARGQADIEEGQLGVVRVARELVQRRVVQAATPTVIFPLYLRDLCGWVLARAAGPSVRRLALTCAVAAARSSAARRCTWPL